MKRRVRVFRGKDQQYYFAVIGDNGETIAQSEGYTRYDDAVNTVAEYYRGWDIEGHGSELTVYPITTTTEVEERPVDESS